jgi:cobalt/nickel transport system permease protein
MSVDLGTFRRKARPSVVEKTLAEISGGIERAVFSEENARKNGFLQRRDARAKLIAFLLLLTAAALSREWVVLAAFYVVILAVTALSSVDLRFFIKRVWLGVGLFSVAVIAPSVFFVGQRDLFRVPLGPLALTVHGDGLVTAGIFVLRVGVCVSLAVLLVLTTKWAEILKSLRTLRVPNGLILVLSMTYRYIFVVMHSANNMFLARKSRIVAKPSGPEQRRWVISSVGVLMDRSVRMSEAVYQAMLARGFAGEFRSLDSRRMLAADWVLLGSSAVAAAAAVYAGVWL